MSNMPFKSRSVMIFGVAVPMALVLGFLLATPDSIKSIGIVGLVLATLTIPLFLRWHHPLLIIAWNATIAVFFLPGRPGLWMLFAGISFGITVLSCILNKEERFQHVPAITWSLVALLGIVLFTAKLSGGIGLRSLGSAQYGGRGYAYIFASIIGYFALSSVRIPPRRAQLYALLFLVSGITFVFSNLAYIAGPNFWFLFRIFPVEVAMSQALADFSPREMMMTRISGLGFAAIAACNVFLLRYGIRGLFDLHKPVRLLLFLLAFGASFAGGFRSTLVIIALTFAVQFVVEGLHRTRALPALALAMVLALAALAPIVTKLPLAVQRSFSIVPFLPVSPVAKLDAQASVEWRLRMWEILLPEVPHYLWLGKGYAINPTDLFLAGESARRGIAKPYEGVLISGDYHSGPLSVIIPFGLPGLLAFGWMLFAGGRVLYKNWKYGDPAFHNINTVLFSLFIAKVIFYVLVFGAFYTDLPIFLGLIGLGIAVNGVDRQTEPQLQAETSTTPALVPAHS